MVNARTQKKKRFALQTDLEEARVDVLYICGFS